MKILVTGGAGFIGSHIVDSYVKAGHDVAIIDNLATGKKENLNSKAKFYKADLTNKIEIQKILLKEKPDVINHQAAESSVVVSVKNPQQTFLNNTIGTVNLLQACVDAKVKRVIFASSGGCMYGDAKTVPTTETAPPSPLSPYGITKADGEFLLAFYAKEYGILYVALRYANVYGPRQDPHGEAGVVAIFLNKMLSKEKPVIFGDGSCVRDYVFVEDVAKANLLALTKAKNETINIGTGKGTSVKEVFKLLKKAVGYTEAPLYGPHRTGDLQRSILQISKAKKTLGWEPKTSLKDGLERTTRWFHGE
ncbi:SDR family oxidoreductase [Candidatus Woesearchaeota archaeon]|nr:SDR family oxidoreductase [Candidatus Woesearchaeota archaeon]